MTRLFIVRHGNTFACGEPSRRIGALTDLGLVASGIAQAVTLGAHFGNRGLTFGHALSGPTRRAQATANGILDQLPSPPALSIATWLDEIDHGPDENQPEVTVVARLGAEAITRWDRWAVPPAGWRVDADTRLGAWRSLFADPPGGDTLLVTSNGAARFALLALSSALPTASLKLRTGAYGLIELTEKGWQVTGWDRRPCSSAP